MLRALSLEREVDHHDRILLDDANQQYQSDETVDIERHPENHQRQQRAERGERQSGENRRRMDEALVENTEHHVDDEDRQDEQR